ncbi:MAG: GNAT family N-acetyltransferase [Acidobacteria bacterium]|nr:GNAT family N-acetyltransferase [Acidobacteriota bacterium]
MSRTTDYLPPKLLEKGFDRTAFDCGIEPLNEYLRKYALQNQKRDAARTYVVVDPDDRILGYYTLVFGAVEPDDVPDSISSGLGRYQIPIILIARLAVDLSEKGKGLGGFLMREAFLRTIQAAEIAGLRAVMVEAKDENARAFYEKVGFRRSPSDQFKLFLNISDIRKNLDV